MNPSELGSMWLRDRAETLRRDASKMERAYEGKLGAMCARVAAKYRAAAILLDDAASELEDETAP